MANYFDQFDAPAAPPPPKNYFDQFDTAQQPAPNAAQPQPSTFGYIGSRLLGGAADAARLQGIGAAMSTGDPQFISQMEQMKPGQAAVNEHIYGHPDVSAPGPVSQVLGGAASAIGSNPAMTFMAPAPMIGGALGSEIGSMANSWLSSPIPDWLARLGGGIIGGGIAQPIATGIKNVASDMANGTTSAERQAQNVLADVAEKKAAIQNGEGMYGQFQQKAAAAAKSLEDVPVPAVADTHPIDMSGTLKILNDEYRVSNPALASLRDKLNANGGQMPFGAIRPLLDDVGPSDLYRAIIGDRNKSLGPDLAAQVTRADRARQAINILQKSVGPDGFYNPAALSRGLFKSPNGDEIGDVTKEVSDMADHASQVNSLMSRWYQANMPRPNPVWANIKRLLGMGAMIGIGKATGSPEAGGVAAGMLAEHPSLTPKAAQLLYGIPPQSVVVRGAQFGAPVAAGILPGLIPASP